MVVQPLFSRCHRLRMTLLPATGGADGGRGCRACQHAAPLSELHCLCCRQGSRVQVPGREHEQAGLRVSLSCTPASRGCESRLVA